MLVSCHRSENSELADIKPFLQNWSVFQYDIYIFLSGLHRKRFFVSANITTFFEICWLRGKIFLFSQQP